MVSTTMIVGYKGSDCVMNDDDEGQTRYRTITGQLGMHSISWRVMLSLQYTKRF